MADAKLIQISPSAQLALAGLDLEEQAPKNAIRVYFQGFG